MGVVFISEILLNAYNTSWKYFINQMELLLPSLMMQIANELTDK